MKAWRYKNALVSAVTLALGTAFAVPVSLAAKPGGETAGNNLSFPVIWSEGVPKVLRGTYGLGNETLAGEYWYQWGTSGDEGKEPASCQADPDELNPEVNPSGDAYCNDTPEWTENFNVAEDRLVDTVMAANPAAFEMELARAYLQKDPLNTWRAWSGDAADSGEAEINGEIFVDGIDWGDNLESVDWYTRSQVRTEVVLFQDLAAPMLEYEMRHTSGWGINEVHGLAASLSDEPEPYTVDYTVEGDPRATVYSHCARLTIQKLSVDRTDPALDTLVWDPGLGWSGEGLINEPIFNMAVHEAEDGPGYYSAEINVKGRIIYGYTWNVRKLNDGAGDYRITFSFDESCGLASLNTFFVEGTTQILVPTEDELEEAAIEAAMSDPQIARTLITAVEEEPGGGAVGKLDFANNLTYMDVRILDRSGGGGGGGGGSGGGGGGSGGGGGGGGGHSRK